jgi:hypothetical protein
MKANFDQDYLPYRGNLIKFKSTHLYLSCYEYNASVVTIVDENSWSLVMSHFNSSAALISNQYQSCIKKCFIQNIHKLYSHVKGFDALKWNARIQLLEYSVYNEPDNGLSSKLITVPSINDSYIHIWWRSSEWMRKH